MSRSLITANRQAQADHDPDRGSDPDRRRHTGADARADRHRTIHRGELLALRWRSVDLDAAVLHVVDAIEETEEHGIRFKDTETGNGRRSISLPEFVVALL